MVSGREVGGISQATFGRCRQGSCSMGRSYSLGFFFLEKGPRAGIDVGPVRHRGETSRRLLETRRNSLTIRTALPRTSHIVKATMTVGQKLPATSARNRAESVFLSRIPFTFQLGPCNSRLVDQGPFIFANVSSKSSWARSETAKQNPSSWFGVHHHETPRPERH